MVEDKNKIVTEILRKSAEERNHKKYYSRTGKCDYNQCQAACCRFKIIQAIDRTKRAIYFSDFNNEDNFQIRRLNGHDCYIRSKLCEHIEIDGGCIIHKSRRQPRVCRYFPMHPDDMMFIAVKGVCGFKFKKLKNKKYKEKKDGRNKKPKN